MITAAERVAVTEVYYRGLYRVAIFVGVAICALAAAIGELQSVSVSLIGSCTAVALVQVAFLAPKGYRVLRRRPLLTSAPAVAVLPLAVLWTPGQVSVLALAVMGPLAVAMCVAQRSREGWGVAAVVSVVIFICEAIAEHTVGGALVVSVFVTTAVLALMLKLAIHWNALLLLSEAVGPEVDPRASSAMDALAHGGLLRRAPRDVLSVGDAERRASWMRAIRELIVNPQARRDAWRALTGFHARELQVLLLLHHHDVSEVARYLSISEKAVRNTAGLALKRERQGLEPARAAEITRDVLAGELAAAYPSAEEIVALAAAVTSELADPDRSEP